MNPRLPELRLEMMRRVLDLPDERLVELAGWLGDSPAVPEKPKYESGVVPPHSQMKAPHSPMKPPHSPMQATQGAAQRVWPRAPVHHVCEHGTYIVTAATLHKQPLFAGPERLDLLEAKLLELADDHGWDLEAWAVFANHYHFVGHSCEGSSPPQTFLGHLHSAAAIEINQWDGEPERQVWHNFWDTRLTFEKSYLARLNYVHQNAVHHGLVPVANQYPWCSAAWFERTATRAQVATIYGFKTDRVNVYDEFDL